MMIARILIAVVVLQTTVLPQNNNRIQLRGGEFHIGQMGGHTRLISTTVTRPDDTATYTTGDVWSNSTSAPTYLTFSNACRTSGGSGVVLGARLVDRAYTSALLGSFELILYNAAPTPVNDNAALAMGDADEAKVVGIVQFTSGNVVLNATAGAGGKVMFSEWNLNRPFSCAAGSTSLYGMVVVRNAYVPVSGEVLAFYLGILQD